VESLIGKSALQHSLAVPNGHTPERALSNNLPKKITSSSARSPPFNSKSMLHTSRDAWKIATGRGTMVLLEFTGEGRNACMRLMCTSSIWAVTIRTTRHHEIREHIDCGALSGHVRGSEDWDTTKRANTTQRIRERYKLSILSSWEPVGPR